MYVRSNVCIGVLHTCSKIRSMDSANICNTNTIEYKKILVWEKIMNILLIIKWSNVDVMRQSLSLSLGA